MEQDDIALAQLDALLLGGAHNVFPGIGRAFLQQLLAEIGRHIEQHAARHDGRHFLDAELLETVGLGEILRLVAVVVDMIDADMAQPVDLRSDAQPAHEDIVVVAGLGRPEAGGGDLVRLQDGYRKAARRERRRLGIDDDTQVIGLAELYQLGGHFHQVRRDVVGRAGLVLRAPLGLGPVLRRRRVRQAERQCAGGKNTQFLHVTLPEMFDRFVKGASIRACGRGP